MEKQKLLVALDQHSISTELCNYLGKIISGKQDLEISLLQLLPPLPPELREFEGSEDPEVEEQLDREMDAVWQRWTREAENTARPVFENAISILTRAGVPPNSIRRIVRQLVITKTSPTISSNSPKKTHAKRSSSAGHPSHGSKRCFIVIWPTDL